MRARAEALELSAQDVDSVMSELSRERRDSYKLVAMLALVSYLLIIGLRNATWLLTSKKSEITLEAVKWGISLDANDVVIGCLAVLAIIAALAIAHASTPAPSDDSRLEEIVSHYFWRVNTSVIAMALTAASLATALGLVATSLPGAVAGLAVSAVSLGLTGLMRQGSSPTFLRALVRRRMTHIETQSRKLHASMNDGVREKTKRRLVIECALVLLFLPLISSAMFALLSFDSHVEIQVAWSKVSAYLLFIVSPTIITVLSLTMTALGKVAGARAAARLFYSGAVVIILIIMPAVAAASFSPHWGESHIAGELAGGVWIFASLLLHIFTKRGRGPFYAYAAKKEILDLGQELEARKLEIDRYR